MNKIVFCGHFNIGEKVVDTDLETVKLAIETGCDIAILINDIDIRRKIQYYIIGGKDMLLKRYKGRIKCGNTIPLCDILDGEQINSIIDYNFYKKLSEEWNEIKLDCNLYKDKIYEYSYNRLNIYGLRSSDIKLYFESELRNLASMRLKSMNKFSNLSWLRLIGGTDLLHDLRARNSSIPVCGAIMLALYEKVSYLGYKSILNIYADKDKEAIINSLRLYKLFSELSSKSDNRWKMKIDNLFVK